MAAKKDKMIPSEKERKRALKYATPAGTGRIWRYLVFRKPKAPDHDSARISRRVKCEKTSKLCWKASGI